MHPSRKGNPQKRTRKVRQTTRGRKETRKAKRGMRRVKRMIKTQKQIKKMERTTKKGKTRKVQRKVSFFFSLVGKSAEKLPPPKIKK